jgi:hypothetical protein
MRIKQITDNLSVGVESFSNSRNWGHKVTAFYNGREITTKKVFYLNRTWERYQFESALLCLMDILDNTKIIPLKDRLAFYQSIKNSNNF